MQLGMIGLGRMGSNMVRRLRRGGHACVVYDRDASSVAKLGDEGATPSASLAELVSKLSPPRAVWVMVPAGEITESVVQELAGRLERDDVVIDGGNSFYKDDVRRARELSARGIHYVDAGTSGGVWGLERGYCLMIGAEREIASRLDPLFATLAPGLGDIDRTPGRDRPELDASAERGYLHCGPPGAGHFVKMIHNGIEYGMMQAYAEGFDLLRGQRSEQLPEELRFDLPVADIAEVWRRGSVVGSWLLDLTATALAESPDLEEFSGFVQDSGEGRWTVQAAIESAVSADVLATALFTRFRSRRDHTYAEKVLSAMRKQFGGHTEPESS